MSETTFKEFEDFEENKFEEYNPAEFEDVPATEVSTENEEEKVEQKTEEVTVDSSAIKSEDDKIEYEKKSQDRLVAEVKKMENTNGLAVSEQIMVVPNGVVINGDITCPGKLIVSGTVTGDIECGDRLICDGEITGNISSDAVTLDGKIRGNLNVAGESEISDHGNVFGDIKTDSLNLAGKVKGNIDVEKVAIVDDSAIVVGDITADSIETKVGAIIMGTFTCKKAESLNLEEMFD